MESTPIWAFNLIDQLVAVCSSEPMRALPSETRAQLANLLRSVYDDMPDDLEDAIIAQIDAEVEAHPEVYDPEGDNQYPSFGHAVHPEYLYAVALSLAPEPFRAKVYNHFAKEQ